MHPLRWIATRLQARLRQRVCVLRIVNRTRATELATRLTVAATSAQRNRGLLGRQRLEPGQGLWIVPCQAVHTFFMRFAIDLVYVDRKMRVRKVKPNVKPWRISTCWLAHSVLELPAGVVQATGTARGDVLDYEEVFENERLTRAH